MNPVNLNLHVEIGVTPELRDILHALLQGTLQFNLAEAKPQQPEPAPVKKQEALDLDPKEIPTPEQQLTSMAAAVEANPALENLLKSMDLELVEANSAEVVRKAMANCRTRICGEGYTKDSPFYRELTGEFKRLAALLGVKKPSELPVEKVEAFVLAISQLKVEDGKLVTEDAPF